MNRQTILTTILTLPKEELQKFIYQCLSEPTIMERMHLFLLLQNPDYSKKLKVDDMV
jgi:hypothetical protein